MVSAAAHFHGFGVARQGPWNTSVNKGMKTLHLSAHLPGVKVTLHRRWMQRYSASISNPM
jgi:hypothetical protein